MSSIKAPHTGHINFAFHTEVRVDKDPHFTMEGTIRTSTPFDIPDSNSAIVRGIQATDKYEMESLSSAEEAVKKAKWAMVFRISMED